MLPIVGGAYLGWALGTNDAANVFGTAVTSRMLRFGTAAVLCSLFLVLGAILQGTAGIHTLRGLTGQTSLTAGLTAIAAAITVSLMTILRLPISASQAVVGAILGIGVMNRHVNLAGLGKVVTCWVTTPIGAAIVALVLYWSMGWAYNRLRLGMFRQDAVLRTGLIVVGSYAAYALGANNVANVASLFLGEEGATLWLAERLGQDMMIRVVAGFGGVCIALGVLTFSRRVMDTVGRGIVKLDAFSSLVVVAAEAITVHVYAVIGVPVSTSQAVIGAVLGVGISRGAQSIRVASVRAIAAGWVLTPTVACVLAICLYIVAHLRYVG